MIKKLNEHGFDSLLVNDLVDEDFVQHFINVLPPVHHSSNMIQMGGAYSHEERGATYSTIVLSSEGWRYVGHCYRGESQNID